MKVVIVLKNWRVISLVFIWALIFGMVLLTPGCGSGRETIGPEQLAEIRKKQAEKRAKEKVEKQKEDEKKKKERAKKQRELAKRKAEAEASRRRAQGRKQLCPHPSQFKDWTDKDFYITKAEQDPRLFEAIDYLAVGCEDADRAVRILGELVTPGTPLTEEELEEIGVSKGRKSYDRQVKLLMQSLVARDTDASVELVEKILSDETLVDARGVAIPTALQAIAAQPTERNEPVFLDAFRQPHEEAGRLLPTILAQGASESFRSTLAEYSMASTCSETRRRAIWEVLCEKDPRNLPAALFLYRDDRLPDSYRKILERQFARLAQSAVSRVCGFPLETSVASKKRQRKSYGKTRQASTGPVQSFSDAELIRQVKANLWNPQFADLLGKRLYQVDSLEEDNQLILLAMNTPRSKPRKMLGDLLVRNWQETPSKLSEIGFPEKVVVEPGFWVVAKQVLRESGEAASLESGARKKGQRSRARQAREPAPVDPIQMAWKQAFGKMLVAMCGRFEAAGRPVYSQDEVTGESTGVSSDAESASEASRKALTMKSLLHSKARPVTECKLQMPDDSLLVHYLRCEELARPEAVLNHYRAKLDSVGGNGVSADRASELSGSHLCWLGTISELSSEGDSSSEGSADRFCSADVLLRIDPNTEPAKNPSGKLEVSIEILLISSK